MGQCSGTANVIIFFSGETCGEKEWQLIEAADPDRILAFAPLSEKLLHELSHRLNPCQIHIDDKTEVESDRMTVQIDGGIGMPPNLLSGRAKLSITLPLSINRQYSRRPLGPRVNHSMVFQAKRKLSLSV